MAKRSRSKVEFNKGWAEELMNTPRMKAHLERLGAEGVAFAERIAPRDTGKYAESFDTDTRVVGDRLMTVITNSAPHAALVELHNNGTGDHVMSRTVDYLRGL